LISAPECTGWMRPVSACIVVPSAVAVAACLWCKALPQACSRAEEAQGRNRGL
jgi:hypothetical protein